MTPFDAGYKYASMLDDYKTSFKNMYGIDARIPSDYKAIRQMAVAATIGGLLGLGRGTFWPGYHEKLDKDGNIVAKKRRSPWLGAMEGAAIGASTSALSNYAGQVAAQYNPEIDAFLKGTAKSLANVIKPKPLATGVDVNPELFARISTTV